MINRFGLYRNIEHRSLIPGLKSNARLDDQTQGWWLPFTDKNGDIHLVDTYHIRLDTYHISCGSINNYTKPIESFIEFNESNKDGTWLIQKSNSEYCYGGSVKMNEDMEKYFELICDLREFTYLYNGDPDDYREDDVIKHVQLYFEHGYPRGITLVRKGAKKDIELQAMNLCRKAINNVHMSWISEKNVAEIKKYRDTEKELSEEARNRLTATIEYLEKVIDANNMIEDAMKEYRRKI